MTVLIRPLDSTADFSVVAEFYRASPDYWLMAEGACDPEAKAAEFFTDAPPGCDPEVSQRLGLFLDGRLSGVAELSFGFPEPGDAFLGLMILGPWARGAGLGRALLAEVERRAREARALTLFLAVLERNRRGRAFWEREGFRPTGISRLDAVGGRIERIAKPL